MDALAPMRRLDNNLWLWAKVGVAAWADRREAERARPWRDGRFDELGCFCGFIGYPRSGHSVVGSILDAHPDAAVSHRLDAFRRLAGATPEAVFHMIVRNTERFAASGRRLTAYAYPIAGQWQGRIRTLRVIGDQEAKWTTVRLAADPGLLRRIAGDRPLRTRLVHVVRNPFDNIATLANRTQLSLGRAADGYFRLCEGVRRIKAAYPEDVLEIRHEALIADPERETKRLCGFVGLDAPADYLRAASALVYRRPNRSRHSRRWSPALLDAVAERAAGFDHLAGYAFAEAGEAQGCR